MSGARIRRISGALVEAEPMAEASLYELVRVGRRRLFGEVLRVRGDVATIQVFEDTGGLALEEPIEGTGAPLALELGPGLLGAVLDGVGRPLAVMAEQDGDFIVAGAEAPTLDRAQRWQFESAVTPGDEVSGGDVLGTVEENAGIVHRVLVPPSVSGVVAAVESGSFSVTDVVARLENGAELTLLQRWPVRLPRPAGPRFTVDRPFVTGQRVFDLLVPVAEGGTVVVPGGFGTGKTVIEQTLAKVANADVVVYIGCGERGNEMAEVLRDFGDLVDERTGRALSERTVLVVNTSNMPVAARESSVYVGMTIAEYYRDMGYRVALMADSLSRWAEALREIGSRLGELPGEEGYPTYMASRQASLYERAGAVRALGSPERTGAVTFISAVSPPGGDFSEPVTQGSLRVAGALWALDAALAHARQFPALDWQASYSLYAEKVAPWFAEEAGGDWAGVRHRTLALLQRERELSEIAAMLGPESLEDDDRLVLEIARVAREALLLQSAFDPNDIHSPPVKTYRIATLVDELYTRASAVLESGVAFDRLRLDAARHELIALRAASAEDFEDCAERAARALADLGGAAANVGTAT